MSTRQNKLFLSVLAALLTLFLCINPAEVGADIVISQDTTISANDFSYDNESIVIDGCTVTIDGSHNFQSLTLRNNAVLTHSEATTTTTSKLDLVIASTLTIDSTSKIDVSGKGYLGGGEGDNSSTKGMTKGNTTEGGSDFYTGGSYGGLGGIGRSNYLPNVVYGDFTNPNELGSGGGGSTSSGWHGGNGGGLVRITAGSIQLDGEIRADGGNSNYGGGSGGGIYINMGSLSGAAGKITANGGTGSSYYGGAGGGGGRIAVY